MKETSVLDELNNILVELEKHLTPILTEKTIELNKKATPLENNNSAQEIHNLEESIKINAVKAYVRLATYLLAIETSQIFKTTFKTKISIELDDINIPFNEQEILGKIKNLGLTDSQSHKLVNLVIKKPYTTRFPGLERTILRKILMRGDSDKSRIIHEIDHIPFLNSRIDTPGIDGIAFWSTPPISATKTKDQALRYLKRELEVMHQYISIAKGKTDQAIRRKGAKNLNDRELLRRELKAP
ncbi:uncharacterized protein ASCRUDRAFT_73120 [Ascoidea rubescens DSM 1968]|uniref:Uncharacterized protein n=1 Tax=Ascoidea rubescens DSM 1968 TaxID=1344418 RepID=A0A1D2V8M5_9ASCO|nr:hypothetical protein ASCRUDRAFT_73120 [Ascoidea rubescens DSM 1968]ODV57793.1 hypothetical protein ASCRUDRAFT_73120 [Ascoidea rubescens DSM 1968]